MAWHRSPLVYPAGVLSAASLVWTTWSLVDLLGAGPVGITVAAGADIIWASVLVADARGLRVNGRRWIVPFFGWVALLAVACFLTWHGISLGNAAMAVAGPFLPLGAKAIWMLAIADMRDPSALTDDELAALAVMERGMVFEEKQHRIEMRRREMGAELQIAEVGTDFRIEIMRQDKARALQRQRPLEIPPTLRDATPGHDAGHDTATGHHAEPRDRTPPVPHHPPIETPRVDRPNPRPALRPASPPAATPRHDTTRDTTTPPLTRTATHDTAPAKRSQTAPRTRKTGPSVRDTILASLRDGIDKDDKDTLRARVTEVHGDDVKPDTFRASLRRAVRELEQGEGFYP